MSSIAAFIGRVLIGIVFVIAGVSKLLDPAATETMITGVGLPSGLAIPVGLFELIAGLGIALGFMTRLFSILLAVWCIAQILFFHNEFQDPLQGFIARQYLAITGGLLCLFAHSQMRWSYDSMRLTRKAEIARRDADEKIHEAELRAAKAEAQADALRTAPVAPAPVVVPPAAPVVTAEPPVAPVAPTPRKRPVDLDGDGIADRDEAIDPRLRP
jgi:putative oxidoreductase